MEAFLTLQLHEDTSIPLQTCKLIEARNAVGVQLCYLSTCPTKVDQFTFELHIYLYYILR